MKKFLILSLLFLLSPICIVSANGTTPVFSHPILQNAYKQINLRIEKKLEKILLDENAQTALNEKKWDLTKILLALDAAIKNKSKIEAVAQIKAFKKAFNLLMSSVGSLVANQTTQGTSIKVSSDPIVSNVTTTPMDFTYYADSFEGKATANGNPFSHANFSAAKCETPLNTFLQVINGNKSIVVKNDDRPNCAKHPDLIDLTKTGFSSIGTLASGRLHGSFVALGSATKTYAKRFVATNTFDSLGVRLESNLPNTYMLNDAIHISGKETGGKNDTLLFFRTPSGKDIFLSQKKDGNGNFSYNYPLEEIGTYLMVAASGTEFKTSTFVEITVFDKSVFQGKKLFTSDTTPNQLDSLDIRRVEFSDLKAIYLIKFPTNDLYAFSASDGKRSITYQGVWSIALRSDTLFNWDGTKTVSAKVTVQKSSSPFTHDAYTLPVTVFEKTLILSPWYKTEQKENIQVSVENGNIFIHGIIPDGVNIKNHIYITLPDGNVDQYTFDASNTDTDGNLKRNIVFEKTIPIRTSGTYLVEVNYDTGFAAYNGPIVYGDALPIFPNEYDGIDQTIGINPASDKIASDVAVSSLASVNAVRTKSGKSNLSLDTALTALATAKANDMANHSYIGHVDSSGERIGGTAKRSGIMVAGGIGENVAGGNVGYEVLMVGLATSGWHRSNMLGNWTKLGIGYAVKDGQSYYVQVCGE